MKIIKRKATLRIILEYQLVKDENGFTLYATACDKKGNEFDNEYISEFTADKEKARKIFKILYKNKVSPCHIKDIIEDHLC